jgi:hypothetical protein
VAAVTLAASLVLTPGLVLALGALGGAVALVLLEALGLTGLLVALLPFIRLPFGMGAVKSVTAALAGGAAAEFLPAGTPWRLLVALGVYGGGLVALRPLPPAVWRRLLRGAVAPAPPIRP